MAQYDQQEPEQAPLISNRMALGIVAILALMAATTLAISLGGKWLGSRLALAGHTASREELLIRIGQDQLQLPANTIRFSEQRHSGTSERIDLYLTWPEMQGYSPALKKRFDDERSDDGLIFLQITQSTMSRDMSGRLDPIYSRLFEGSPMPGPFGLTAHRFRADSGYGDETMLTASRQNLDDYTVRCLMPVRNDSQTHSSLAATRNASCQRDIRAGQDLTILYRFSPMLLRDWLHIDAAIARFVRERVISPRTTDLIR